MARGARAGELPRGLRWSRHSLGESRTSEVQARCPNRFRGGRRNKQNKQTTCVRDDASPRGLAQKCARHLPQSSSVLLFLQRNWASWAQTWPRLAEFGQCWANIGRSHAKSRQVLAEMSEHLARFEPNLASSTRIVQITPEFDQLFGQILSEFVQRSPE